jgi:hypothetical protein
MEPLKRNAEIKRAQYPQVLWAFALMAIVFFGAALSELAPAREAQTNKTEAPAFEAASIDLSTSMRPGGGDFISPGRYTIRNRNVRYVIREAFRIKDYQIADAPSWIDWDNYDIVAKASYAAESTEMEVMLRTLLADRFQLRFHRVETEVKGCALEVGKAGPKFHEFLGQPGSDPAKVGILMRKGVLSGRVINMREAKLPDDPNLVPESLPNALQSQLGLKLVVRKIPLEMFVIERPSAT